jgi:glycosyltransferase involved in cell wall biosynthesis
MIVKNEVPIIARCLESIRPHVDFWVIVDTGSSDGTQELVRDLLSQVPGELHERPWQDFAHNRTEAIRLAEGKADYLLFCDADMGLVVRDPAWKEKLVADCYQVIQKYDNGFYYANVRLVNARLTGERRWRYWGSTHEYCAGVAIDRRDEPAVIDTIAFVDYADGSSRPEKCARDSALLERDLAELERLESMLAYEPERAEIQTQAKELRHLEPRNVFYLAQTYHDMGRLDDCLGLYERRVALGGWIEEVWYALYQIARVSEDLGLPETTVLERYLRAYEYRPQRAEPLVNLARFYRDRRRYALAHLFAKRAMEIPRPAADYLFVDGAHYDWMIRDEYAVATYWMGEYRESARVCQELLDGPALPERERARVIENLNFATRALER